MESPFSSWIERFNLEYPNVFTKDPANEEKQLIGDAGNKHEAAYLSELKKKYNDVCEIARDANSKAATKKAIQARRRIIFQPHLEMEEFSGYADFLRLNSDNEYEILDTKLARSVKPYFLIQLCCYAEMLSKVTNEIPQTIGIILGSNEERTFPTNDFFDYYLSLKNSFLNQMNEWDEDVQPFPQPSAEHRDWSQEALKWMHDKDHLSLIASINHTQIKKLNDQGIQTVKGLSEAANDSRCKGMHSSTFQNLKDQARLQIETRDIRSNQGEETPPAFEIKKHENRGLFLLPPSSPQDIFFDLEGFPLAEGGLEYLWGATYHSDEQLQFIDWWAHNHSDEEAAFISFIDWAVDRWKRDPRMHIYHYAPYEKTALRRIAGRCGKREEELDDLLRNEVFVDLYQIVRQGLIVGEESYSIKKIERLYRSARSGEVNTSMGSVVAYADWMESGEPKDWRKSPLLESIRSYNKDDCDSTWELYSWLQKTQKDSEIIFQQPANKTQRELTEKDLENRRSLESKRLLQSRLEKRAKTGTNPCNCNISKLFSQLLDFHRREDKPTWWQLFDWNETEHELLVEDPECLGLISYNGDPPQLIKKSYVFTCEYPTQPSTIKKGSSVKLTGSLKDVQINEIIPSCNRVEIKISISRFEKELEGVFPPLFALLPHAIINTKTVSQSIERVSQSWLENESIPPALRDFINRSAPNLVGFRNGEKLADGQDIVSCKDIVSKMESTTLCIQGPPGAGKTYLASHLINHLLKQGKKIGITSNSHDAILNLITGCIKHADTNYKVVKVGGDKNNPILLTNEKIVLASTSEKASSEYEGGLIGGTAWFFSREDMQERLDYLFIDEAGQVSVANLVAISQCTKNLVLIGDQNQLQQPLKGSHPGKSGYSLLDYYLEGHSVIPKDKGIFLGTTWRMHPEICEFVSTSFYNKKLLAHPDNKKRSVLPPKTQGSLINKYEGIVFVPVEHLGNSRDSAEEANAAIKVFEELQDLVTTNEKGEKRTLTINDFLFIAPYNVQVSRLREALPENARVGSVDRFQGQEAKVVIITLGTSYGESSPRGIQFLLNKNRVNVAISRAQILTIIIGDPRLATNPAHTVSEMECLNLMAKITNIELTSVG
ncbi:TM0106 family RecB-like putative nuclease [Akkermansiaceae bacterium]|nr:TM0106 family RecB-like putative nuclease [Akkermansiaceae bacterium]